MKTNFLNIDTLESLYRKYLPELMQFTTRLNMICKQIRSCGLAAIDVEILYLMIREHRPKTIVEISPDKGYSTYVICSAMNDNEMGHLWSYDLNIEHVHELEVYNPIAGKHVKYAENSTFIEGDVKEQYVPDEIDYLFLDSDHSYEFADWYIENLFPKVKPGGLISIDDMWQKGGEFYHYQDGIDPAIRESRRIEEFLKENNLDLPFSCERHCKDIRDMRSKAGVKTMPRFNNEDSSVHGMTWMKK